MMNNTYNYGMGSAALRGLAKALNGHYYGAGCIFDDNDVCIAVTIGSHYVVLRSGKILRYIPNEKKGGWFKELAPRTHKTGYRQVYIDGQIFTVHKLVAYCFLPPAEEGQTDINHINGDKTDNRAENLERCTRSENMKHAYRLGLKRYSGGRGRVCLNA